MVLPKLSQAPNDLVAAKADVLVASGAELALQAADAARPPVPITSCLANNFDPIARGYVKSLSHPGGNITGLVYRQPELAAKQLELLALGVPGPYPGRPAMGSILGRRNWSPAERVARSLRLTLRPLELENLASMIGTRHSETCRNARRRCWSSCRALLFTPHRARIAELAVRIACHPCTFSGITSRPAGSYPMG